MTNGQAQQRGVDDAARRRRFENWEDRLCCAALVAAAMCAAGLLGWYVWHMPHLR